MLRIWPDSIPEVLLAHCMRESRDGIHPDLGAEMALVLDSSGLSLGEYTSTCQGLCVTASRMPRGLLLGLNSNAYGIEAVCFLLGAHKPMFSWTHSARSRRGRSSPHLRTSKISRKPRKEKLTQRQAAVYVLYEVTSPPPPKKQAETWHIR